MSEQKAARVAGEGTCERVCVYLGIIYRDCLEKLR